MTYIFNQQTGSLHRARTRRSAMADEDGFARLQRAVEQISTNLGVQRKAIAEHQKTVARLKSSVGKLEKNLTLFDRNLAAIDTSPIKRKALRLYGIMDAWEKR